MGKATNSIVKSRVDALKALILSGSSNSVCVEHASQHWGLSRRQSYRLLKRAWSEVREDVDSAGIDRQEMLCWCIHQLMAAAREGVKISSRQSLSAPVASLMRCLVLDSAAPIVGVMAGVADLT